jgi:CRP-like cAMP-binding protein
VRFTQAPTAEDLAWWNETVAAGGRLDEADRARVAPHVRACRLARGEVFLRAGEPAVDVGLIRSGLVREKFVLADGDERTRAFGVAGDFAGSLSDLLRGGPSRTEVEACADTRVLVVPWSRISDAVAASAGWRRLLERITQRLYLAKSDREYELFRARFPRLESAVAQKHVASYLGITPEHLSRVRAQLGVQRARAGRRTASAAAKPPRNASQRAK